MASAEPPPAQPTSLGIEVVHAFGSLCGKQLREGAFFGDEVGEVVIQPLGRHLAFRHLGSGEMSFAVESERVEAITACAISRDRELIAVCERCAEDPLTQVSIYDLHSSAARPEQTLQEFGGRVGRLTCAAFSPDSPAGVLILASAEPELLLLIVDWRNNVVLGKCQLPSIADRIAFSPLDSCVVSASGPSFVKVWRMGGDDEAEEEGQAAVPERPDEPVPFGDAEGLRGLPALFTDHAWLEPPDGTFALCTAEGPLHIISSVSEEAEADGEAPQQEGGASDLPVLHLVCTIEAPFQAALGGSAPLCVRCFPNGFVLGGSQGAVAVWERPSGEDDATGELQHITTVQAGRGDSDVRCVDVTGQSELRVLMGFENADILHVSLESMRESCGQKAPCTVVAGGFHGGPITSLDLAVQRPIIVTASRKDSSVRVWNYAIRRCELFWEFPNEDPTSVAIHPLGYFLAVSFSDKLRFMQILWNELKLHRELSIRGVRLVRFANGGHLLAAVQGKLVVVFSVRTLAKVATLRGHSQQVTSICFDPDDRSLTTCGEDGSLCEWSTQYWTKLHDCPARTFEAQALAVGNDGCTYSSLAEGGRVFLRSYQHCVPNEQDDLPLPGELCLSAMVHQSGPQMSALLAGASDGSLRTFTFLGVPICGTLGLHCGACTAVCISGDARTLATAGEDGVVFVLRVSGLAPEVEGKREALGAVATAGTPNGEVVMINRGEIQARFEETEALSAEASRLKVQLVEDAARLESECRERQARAQQKDQEEIQSLRLRYESLQQAATAKERESLRTMKAMEAAHVQAADQLEQSYDKQIRNEADRFMTLDAELQRLEGRLEALQADSRRRLEQQRSRQAQDLLRHMQEKDADIQRLKDLAAFSQHRFDVMLDQENMEHDFECSDLNRRHQEDLEQLRLVEYRRKKEQDSLIRGLDALEKDRERIRKEQEETRATENSLRLETDGLQRSVANLKAEMREREALLRDRELEIGSYKQKVSTLKKFRHVLDFRLREVAESVQPKDRMIEQLGEQLCELEAELERQLAVHRQMESTLRSKREQAVTMAAESERLRDAVKHRERSIFQFTTDLHALATEEQDTRLWPQGIRRIYRDHADPERIFKDVGSLGMQELSRQIGVMQQKATSLVAKGKHTEATCRADIGKKMEDNTELIREVDGLRVEKRALERQLRDLGFRVALAEKRLASGRGSSAPALSNSSRKAPALASGPAAAATEGAAPKRQSGGTAAEAPRVQAPRKKAQVPRATPEERAELRKLLVAADRGGQQVQLKHIENKLLKDHLTKLQTQSRVSSAG